MQYPLAKTLIILIPLMPLITLLQNLILKILILKYYNLN
jgi:hypothetical protein